MPTLEALQRHIETASPGVMRKPQPPAERAGAGGDQPAERTVVLGSEDKPFSEEACLACGGQVCLNRTYARPAEALVPWAMLAHSIHGPSRNVSVRSLGSSRALISLDFGFPWASVPSFWASSYRLPSIVRGMQGELICCDGTKCDRIYHLECVGLTAAPNGNWYPRPTAATSAPGLGSSAPHPHPHRDWAHGRS